MLQRVQEIDTYLAAFAELEAQRTGPEPAWRTTLRRQAIAALTQSGFPTTRDEAWKYTSVAPILKTNFSRGTTIPTLSNLEEFTYPESRHSQLVFINGLYAPGLSNVSGLPAGVLCGNFAAADQNFLAQQLPLNDPDAFASLNMAFAEDGAVLIIPRGMILETPVHLLFIAAGAEKIISHPRLIVVAEEGAMGTVVESYVAASDEEMNFTNAVTTVIVKKDAALTHYRLQAESTKAFQLATTLVHQERGSNYVSFAIALGGAIARHNLNVMLADENIESTIDGLYVATGTQHLDNQTTIDHAHPHCRSFQLYKGILDEKARTVFNGKIFVREGALLTDARQLNKNLLLSKEAQVNTKPQLEIFADDVKCSHGATIGQLDEDEIFYLRSRGLKTEAARALLTYGFAEDVISKIKIESVRQQLDELVLTRLHQNLEIK